MRSLSCFPVFSSWSSQKKRKNVGERLDSSKDLPGKLAAKVWPGDDAPPTIPFASPSKDAAPANDKSMELDCRTGSASFSSSPELSPVVKAQALEPVERSSSMESALKHVEDWVRNLEELDELDDDRSEEEDVEQDSLTGTASGIPEDHTDPDRDLKALVVQSLHSLASVARLSGIGLRSPPSLGSFSNLRSLSLSGNSISKILPGCLPKSLHFLDLSRNNISVIEGLRGLNRLRVLNLSHNRISRIRHGLGNCPSIRELYLSGNKISEVEGLHRLRKLFLLDLSNNRLTTAKSLLQLAANYSCLRVLNLLGNALLLNLGDEQMKRLLAAIAPHLTVLNKQPIRAVASREARFAEAHIHGAARKARRSSGSKAKRVESLQACSSRKNAGRRRNKHF